MNKTYSTLYVTDRSEIKINFLFVGFSAACCIITLAQFILEKELKDIKRNFFLHSFLTLLECILIFVFNEHLIQSSLYEKVLICLVWTLHALLKASSFMLFWVQRKLFYRQTALVNNSTSKVNTAEKFIAFFSLATVAFKCAASIMQVLKSKYLDTENFTRDCDIFTADKWNFVFISWSYLLRILLLAVMFEPIISHWNRLSSSRQINFNFRMKIRVMQPALLSFLYVCANCTNVISWITYRENPCSYMFGEKILYVQLMPIFYLIAVIIPYEKLLQLVFKFCERPYPVSV